MSMSDTSITLTRAQLDVMLDQAVERGAARALSLVGLGDSNALRDVAEIRSLVDAYRAVKSSVIKTIAQTVTIALLGALASYYWFKH